MFILIFVMVIRGYYGSADNRAWVRAPAFAEINNAGQMDRGRKKEGREVVLTRRLSKISGLQECLDQHHHQYTGNN